MMKLSIVVPAFNEAKLLAASLEAIKAAAAALTQRGWSWELIVCDNNSTDGTTDIAKAKGATVVFEPINQIGRARNRGAEAANGDWLLFVDADSYPSCQLLDDMAAQIESGKVAAGGAVVRMDARDWAMDFATWVWNQISKNREWMAGSFIFCDTRAFREVGGFSSNLYVSEELDLSQRLHKWAAREGKKIVILRKHPLLTSARKAKLYSRTEYLKLFLRFFTTRGRVVKDRAACAIWYDGRR